LTKHDMVIGILLKGWLVFGRNLPTKIITIVAVLASDRLG
jgi:hypothetical protein